MATEPTEESILVNEDPLDPSFHPATLPERSRTVERLGTLLPTDEAGEPVAATVYGPAGNGKTAVLTEALAAAEADGATTVELTATPATSAYELSVAFAQALGADIASTGIAYETACSAGIAVLRDIDGPVVAALDDVDRLADSVRQEFVTDLLEPARQQGLALLATATDVQTRNAFGPAVKGTLCERELVLSAYSPAEIEAILRRRADAAFAPDSVPERTVERAAALATADGASATEAIALLGLAGERAAEAGADTLAERHVDAVADRARAERLRRTVDGLNDHERLTLSAVHELADDAVPARTDRVYERYEATCERAGVDPNTRRSVQNYLTVLERSGLVEAEQVRTDRGGQFCRYRCPWASTILDIVLGDDSDGDA